MLGIVFVQPYNSLWIYLYLYLMNELAKTPVTGKLCNLPPLPRANCGFSFAFSLSTFAWMTSQPTFCWFLMSQAVEWSPGNCGHDAVSAFSCKPPVCWASRAQLSLITAMSVCLQLTCCASRCVKMSLRATPLLKQGRTLNKHLSRVFHRLFIKMLL